MSEVGTRPSVMDGRHGQPLVESVFATQRDSLPRAALDRFGLTPIRVQPGHQRENVGQGQRLARLPGQCDALLRALERLIDSSREP